MPLLGSHAAWRFRPEMLLRPESVAVLGAATPAGRHVLANLRAGRFAGPIMEGEGVADAVAALPTAPDLAVLAGDGPGVSALLSPLAARGTFAVVAVGMSDPAALADAARRTGVRVLGPGAFGVITPAIGLDASRGHLGAKSGRLALVSQSGALCRAVLDWAGPNGIGFSHIIGIGFGADLGLDAVLDWLAQDAETGAILLDIRRIRDRRGFLSAARACARTRPVVAIRAGGRLADRSGEADRALEAALRRAGILSVRRLDDFLAAAETLTRARTLRGERLAIVTNAIGPARLAADAAIEDGLTLATLSEASQAAIAASLPEMKSTLDYSSIIYVGINVPVRLAEVSAMLAGAPEIDAVLAVHAPAGADDGTAIRALCAAAIAIRVPLLVAVIGETTAAAHRRQLAEAGVCVFATPEQAVRGFGYLVQDRRNRAAARELPTSRVLRRVPDAAAARRIIDAARTEGRTALAQDESLAIIAAYFCPVMPTHVAGSVDAAVAAAERIGYPVALKQRRSSPDEGGRTDAQRGGLVLGLQSADEVRIAGRALLARDPSPSPMLLVQPEAAWRARSLMISVHDDPMLGPVIGFGVGGLAAVALNDMAVDLPPLNLMLARSLIARTRIAGVLDARDGSPAAPAEAIAEILVRVSQLIVDHPDILGLMINPLFCSDAGTVAADAWITLRPPGAPGSRLAIAPYPTELEERWTDAEGETLTIRPIRPEDAEQHGRFFSRLAPEDVRFRFFSALRALTPEMTARMTQVDYDREMAFISVRDDGLETCGVARLVIEPGGTRAEFALIVEPAVKGRGVARHLMQRLLDWADRRGVTEVVGPVLADNAPMLAFIRRLGFTIHRMPEESSVVEAVRTLGGAA